jgi:hypothetical protein
MAGRNSSSPGRTSRGAAVDFLTPATKVIDSSVVRVVFPAFESRFMDLLRAERLDLFEIDAYPGPDGRTRFTAAIGDGGDGWFIVTLDENLTPLDVGVGDAIRGASRAWSAADADRYLSASYLAAWLARHRTFGVGW